VPLAELRPYRLIGRLAQSPVRPSWPQFATAPLAPGLREHRVHLLQRQLLERVVLVHIDRERVVGRPQLRGLIAILGFELVDLGGSHRARHRAELRGTGDQRGRRGGAALALDLDLDVRIHLEEGLGPQRHHVVHRVGADAVDVAGDSRGLLVRRQAGIDLDLLGERGGREGRERRRRHETLHGTFLQNLVSTRS